MDVRLVLALACVCVAVMPHPTGSSAARAASAPAPAYMLALRFAPGERINEHAYVVDRVTWILPPAKLEQFRAQGVIIEEQTRTQLAGTGLVTSLTPRGASVKNDLSVTLYDVPRHIYGVARDRSVAVITSANTQAGASQYSIEDAPMIELPRGPVVVGSRWTTRQRVGTTIGSGMCTFHHVVAAVDVSRIRIDVSGSGSITGKEYHLPRLLPGTIALSGSAWFDSVSGLIVQESYHVENTLVKTLHGERLGFVESLDADTDAHKEAPAASRTPSHAR